MSIVKLILIMVLFFAVHEETMAKAKCKPLLKKLYNVQAQQRHGYSLKKGRALAKKEAQARNDWWQCERGRSAKVKTQKSSLPKSLKKTRIKKSPVKSIDILENVTSASFSGQNSVGVKSKYSGEQLKRWLIFYQPPKKCQRPKSTQMFAYCVEHKSQQQQVFERQDKLN